MGDGASRGGGGTGGQKERWGDEQENCTGEICRTLNTILGKSIVSL